MEAKTKSGTFFLAESCGRASAPTAPTTQKYHFILTPPLIARSKIHYFIKSIDLFTIMKMVPRMSAGVITATTTILFGPCLGCHGPPPYCFQTSQQFSPDVSADCRNGIMTVKVGGDEFSGLVHTKEGNKTTDNLSFIIHFLYAKPFYNQPLPFPTPCTSILVRHNCSIVRICRSFLLLKYKS